VGFLLSQVFIIKKQMKHILNNLSNEEKNSIREQHTGGMNVITENFSKLINSKLGDSKPLVEMEEMPEGMFSRELSKTDKLKRDIDDAISRKIASPKTTGVPGKWSYGEEEKSFEQILNDIENVVSRYRGEESESFVSEQSINYKQEYVNLGKKLQKKYPEICKYDTIKKNKDGSSVSRLNTGGKIYSFDSDVKKYQELHNKNQPSYKIKVDGIIGPEMKKLFCTVA
jgi:hypothetical protein